MPGPRPTPTTILKLRGSGLVKHRKNEPQPRRGLGKSPRWMNKAERTAWKKTVPELNRTGVVAAPDAEAMARYCTLQTWWHECREFIAKNGTSYPIKAVTVNTRSGETREYIKGYGTYPQVKMAMEFAAELRRLEQEFGLTPASRTRIKVDVPEKQEATGKGRFFRTG